MPSSRDPDVLSTDERTRELAGLLATGLRRLRQPISTPPHSLTSATQNLAENAQNELASAAEQSVTVHAG
jgi:hypothetical protein